MIPNKMCPSTDAWIFRTLPRDADDKPPEEKALSKSSHKRDLGLAKRQAILRIMSHCPADAPGADASYTRFYESFCDSGRTAQDYTIRCESRTTRTDNSFQGKCRDDEICVDGRRADGFLTKVAYCIHVEGFIMMAMDWQNKFFWRHTTLPREFRSSKNSNLEIRIENQARTGLYTAAKIKALAMDDNNTPTKEFFDTCDDCDTLVVDDWPDGTTQFGVQVNPQWAGPNDVVNMHSYAVRTSSA